MNKIQTILLSAGVILTTASATVLSHTLLVAPYETTTQSQVEAVETTKPVVVNEVSIRSTEGYEYTFTRDNVRTSVEEVSYHTPSSNLPEGYRVTQSPTSVKVTANGVQTDLTGEKIHSSGEKYCKVGDTVVTRYFHNVRVVAKSGYNLPDVVQPNGVVIGGKYISTEEDLGVMSMDEYEQLSTPYVQYVIKEHIESYDHNDTQIIPGKYINSGSVICESAKRFNLI